MPRGRKYFKQQISLSIDDEQIEILRLMAAFRRKRGVKASVSGIIGDAIEDYFLKYEQEVNDTINEAKAIRQRYLEALKEKEKGDDWLS